MQDSITIAFLGTGGKAGDHLRHLAAIEGVQIVGLCDIVGERAAQVAQQYGGKPYTDYRRMIDELDMDALYVCVPPFAH